MKKNKDKKQSGSWKFKTALAIALSTSFLFSGKASAETDVLRVGDRGDKVEELQRGLRVLELYDYPELEGFFGTDTRSALMNFQKEHGLEINGVANSETMRKMDEALDEYYPEIVYTRTMRLRSVGPDVRCLQRVLKTMGYYGTRPDGIYNANTASAVRTFQFDYGMSVDGVVNERLVKKINSVAATLRPLREATPEQIREAAVENGNDEQVENEYHTDAVKIQWSAVDAEWKTGATMKVIDVATGVSFRVKRVGGVNHADVEPRSVDDTEKMREVFGGNWSWTRRPVVVQISYLTAAASLCGMPHGDTVIADNGIDGHFCIHFYESQTDNYRSVTDNAHQKAINEAAKYSV